VFNHWTSGALLALLLAMTGAIAPIRSIRPIRREAAKGAVGQRTEASGAFNVSITVAPAEPPAAPTQPPTNLDAHLAAQEARVRGLRGGQNVLDNARHAYLQTEYSGPDDRRLHAGRITRKDV
jgi:hypothetical protein